MQHPDWWARLLAELADVADRQSAPKPSPRKRGRPPGWRAALREHWGDQPPPWLPPHLLSGWAALAEEPMHQVVHPNAGAEHPPALESQTPTEPATTALQAGTAKGAGRPERRPGRSTEADELGISAEDLDDWLDR